MSGIADKLDAPGTVCAFASFRCSEHLEGAGGFDQHHPIPVELGGAPDQLLLALCPNHHRRQHSLIRYLVECLVAAAAAEWVVLERFTADERHTAQDAVDAWDAAGRPEIKAWPCPAARAA